MIGRKQFELTEYQHWALRAGYPFDSRIGDFATQVPGLGIGEVCFAGVNIWDYLCHVGIIWYELIDEIGSYDNVERRVVLDRVGWDRGKGHWRR